MIVLSLFTYLLCVRVLCVYIHTCSHVCSTPNPPPLLTPIPPPQVHSGMFGRTMVFTSTKHEANELVLNSSIKQDCQVLHGDIPQKQREVTLKVHRYMGGVDL